MLLLRDPCEAYRRVDFDARVTVATPRQLVDLCFEQLIGSLDRVLYAQGRGDNRMKSAALTRAIASLTALQLGVDETVPTGAALIQLYRSARRSVLDCAVRFDAQVLDNIRRDFIEIRDALLRNG